MAEPTRIRTGAIVALGLGNALAFYDLIVFGVFAVQIGRAIFPSGDETAQLLLTLGTFGIGFLTRPLGALVVGRYADRAGRKPAMILSFSLAGIAVLGQALVPSYAAVGMLAPALMLTFRLLLGFAIGGEIGPTTAYLVEAAPPERRGFIVSISFATQDSGALLAGVVGYSLAVSLSDAQLIDWGWRAAMLLGVLVIPFGLMVRARLEETLEESEGPHLSDPVHGRSVRWIAVIALALIGAATVGNYGLTFLNIYAQTTLGLHASTAFGATIAMGLAAVTFDLVGGHLSDRFGRRPVTIVGLGVLGCSLIPGFWLLNQAPTLGMLMGVTFWLTAWSVLGPAAAVTAIAEGFPMRQRSAALALSYSIAVAVLGGSTEFVVAWLNARTGDPLAPAYYILLFTAVGLLAAYIMPETAPTKRPTVPKG